MVLVELDLVGFWEVCILVGYYELDFGWIFSRLDLDRTAQKSNLNTLKLILQCFPVIVGPTPTNF